MPKVEITEQDVLNCTSTLEWRNIPEVLKLLENNVRTKHGAAAADELSDAQVAIHLNHLTDKAAILRRLNQSGPRAKVEYLKNPRGKIKPKVVAPKLHSGELVSA